MIDRDLGSSYQAKPAPQILCTVGILPGIKMPGAGKCLLYKHFGIGGVQLWRFLITITEWGLEQTLLALLVQILCTPDYAAGLCTGT